MNDISNKLFQFQSGYRGRRDSRFLRAGLKILISHGIFERGAQGLDWEEGFPYGPSCRFLRVATNSAVPIVNLPDLRASRGTKLEQRN